MPAAALLGVAQASIFEWIYHRYWLHRPWLPPQMFTAHTLVHHQLCKNEDTFQVHDEEQEEALTFQWWGGPILVSLNMVPWVVAWGVIALMHVSVPFVVPVVVSLAATFTLYYFAYEGLHSPHAPPTIGWIERSGPFQFIEHHHRLHHIYMGKNFNVVVPFADLMLGTLVLIDPAEPKVTSPAAREVARRHSKYGRELRARQAAQSAALEAPVQMTEAQVREATPREVHEEAVR